ncbi:RNA dependent RNA polymerase [Rice Mononega-like virus]|nr:RNA dependent RNA polymerase [Rice Mononega-like virus]
MDITIPEQEEFGLIRESVMTSDDKLNVAMRASTVTCHLKILSLSKTNYTAEHHMSDYIIENIGTASRHRINYNIYPRIALNIMRQPNLVTKSSSRWLDRAYEITTRVAREEIWAVLSQAKLEMKPDIVSKINLETLLAQRDRRVDNLIYSYHHLKGAVDKYNRLGMMRWDSMNPAKSLESRQITIDIIDLEMYIGSSILWLKYENRWHVLPNVYLLLIFNKICDLISVLTYSHYMDKITFNGKYHDIIVEFVEEFFSIAESYQDSFFDIAKSLESLVQAEIILIVDNDKRKNTKPDRSYLYSMILGLREIDFDYEGSNLQHIIRSLPIPLMNEVGCLSKIAGHPFVKSKEGLDKQYLRSSQVKMLDLNEIRKTRLTATKLLISNYIKVHKKWPKVSFSEGCSKRLKNAYRRNIDPNSGSLNCFGVISLEDYEKVEIEKNEDLELFEDIIPLLKDKTITRYTEQVEKEYINNMWDKSLDELNLSTSRKNYYQDTRLLLYYLCNDIDGDKTTEFMDRYNKACSDKNWDLLRDYNVIRLVPKEKELKTLPRFFGCQSFYQRFRCLNQEYNCANHLEKYSCEQAMTQNGLQMSLLLHRFRNIGRSYRGYTAIFVNLDAESWCAGFRNATVEAVAGILDKYYGTNIYGSTMEYYQNTLFYLNDPEGCYYYRGTNGGIEGLNQYTWLFVYINQIHTALETLNRPYHVLCKGDDLRVAIMIKNDEFFTQSLETIKKNILLHITKACQKVGHTIKANDSYASFNYFAFSKSASVSDIELPQAFRKIQKLYGANNAALNVKGDYISATFSNAHSACGSTTNQIPCYLTGLLWCMIYITRDRIYSKLSDDQMVALCLTPSVVGGLPIIYLDNMLVRAESDMLSPFIMRIQRYESVCPPVAQAMSNFLCLDEYPEQTIDMLQHDAYAIPLGPKPTLARTYLRKELQKRIARISQNTTINELLDPDLKDLYNVYKDMLNSAKTVNPRILASMYSISVWGTFDSFVKKFDGCSSIIKALCGGKGFSAQARKHLFIAQGLDRKLHQWIYKRITERPNTDYSWNYWKSKRECPGEIAQYIRNKLFHRTIEGVTMSPPGHQLYIRPQPTTEVPSDYEKQNRFVIYYDETPKEPLHAAIEKLPWDYRTGRKEPQIGGMTSTGNIKPEHKISEYSKTISNLMSNLTLSSWVDVEGSNVRDVLSGLFRQFTTVDQKLLDKCYGTRKSGTITHHQPGGGFEPRIMFNGLTNNTTKFAGVSSSHQVLYKNNPKMHLNFLHVLLHNLNVVILNKQMNSNYKIPEVMWAVTKDCIFCNRPVVDTPIFFDPVKVKLFLSRVKPLISFKNIVKGDQLLKDFVATRPPAIADRRTIDGDIEEATEGLLNSYMRDTMEATDRLIDNLGVQNYNERGFQRIISLTTPSGSSTRVSLSDLKRMNPSHIIRSLLVFTWSFFRLKFENMDSADVISYVRYSRSFEFPWLKLLNDLKECNVLINFVQAFSELTGNSMINANDTDLCAREIGLYAMHTVFRPNMLNPKLVRFSYWAKEDASVLLARQFKAGFKTILQYYHQSEDMVAQAWIDFIEINFDDRSDFKNIKYTIVDSLVHYISRWFIEECSFDDIEDRINIAINNRIKLDSDFFDRYSTNIINFIVDKTSGDTISYYSFQFGNLTALNEDSFMAGYNIAYDDLLDIVQREEFQYEIVNMTYETASGIIRGQDVQELSNIYRAPVSMGVAYGYLSFRKITEHRRYNTNRYSILPRDIVISSPAEIYAEGSELRSINFDPKDVYYKFKCGYHRVYGIGTSTPTYILEILHDLGLKKKVYRSFNVLAAADGFGGITDVFMRILSSSNFKYVTLQDYSSGITGIAPMTAVLLRERDHTCDFSSVNSALNDLTQISHVKDCYVITNSAGIAQIIEYNLMYCDATFKRGDESKCAVIFKNLYEVYKSMRNQGLFIMRMDIRYLITYETRKIIASYINLSETFELFKPSSSSYEYEIYLILRRNVMEELDLKDSILSLKTVNNIVAWYNTWVNKMQKELDGRRVIPIPREFKYLNYIRFPGSFTGSLQRYGLIIERDRSYEQVKDIIRHHTECVELNIYRTFHTDTISTLAEKVRKLGKFLFFRGMNYYLQAVESRVCVEEELIETYVGILTLLLKTARIRLKLQEALTVNEKLGHYDFPGYQEFLKGIRIGYRCISYYKSIDGIN